MKFTKDIIQTEMQFFLNPDISQGFGVFVGTLDTRRYDRKRHRSVELQTVLCEIFGSAQNH